MADVVDASFTKPEISAEECKFEFKLPNFTFGLKIPPFPPFPPPIPFPRFRLAISCDLSNPVDVSASIEPGGGRTSNADPSPDDDESF
jgi:hypothetical protein